LGRGAAADSGLFTDHGLGERRFDMPLAWDDPVFLPFDWGYFAFVYDRAKVPAPPADFVALAGSDLKIIIEDPRSSTPGLGLLLWVKMAYGEGAAKLWADLADNIVTVTPGWSEAYDLFLKGEADMVLSYTTSPAYHLIAEKDDSKAAAAFSEGHYMQVEVAAKVASSREPDLGERFLAYMISPEVQGLIPETNWMYPAITPKAGLPAGFDTLVAPVRALVYPAGEARKMRDEALGEWLAALGR
jgi:thiamine transport system substrate-binding protein